MKNRMFYKMLSFVLVVVFVCLSTFTNVSAVSKDEQKWLTFNELCKEKGFVNGIQHPYMTRTSAGNDWGYSPLDGYAKCNFKEEDFMKVFYNCKAMGYDIYKTWLNYNQAGMIYDSNDNVVGIDPTYIENLPKILKMAQDAGLYICLATFDHKEGYNTNSTSSFNYERATKYIHNEESRKMLFENWLRPIIEVTKDFPNVVLIDLYVEPEADGGKWNVPNGTNWEEMREFIKEENDFIKSINPRLETYSSATTDASQLYEFYNDLGMDYYAIDYYTSKGGSLEPSEMFLDAPFIYGEVGIKEGTATKGDDFVSNWLGNYYEESVLYGVKCGFYWSYGWGGEGNMTVLDKYGRPRSAMVSSRFWQLDREYQLNDNYPEMDKPAIAYSTNEKIIWMGSRGAEKYRIERTSDLEQWTEILSIDYEEFNSYEYSTLMYETKDNTAVPGNKYYYRVVSTDYEGNEVASDLSNLVDCKKVTCDESQNLIKNYSFEDEEGFNSNGRDGKWCLTSQNSKNEAYNLKYIKDGVEGETSYTGTHAVSKARRLKQYVTVKPHTDYTFTFFVKFDNKDGYWNHFVGLLTDTPNSLEYEVFDKEYNTILDCIQVPQELKDGQWHRMTYFFNSGEYSEIAIDVSGYHTKADNPDWYIDDFYLFETE